MFNVRTYSGEVKILIFHGKTNLAKIVNGFDSSNSDSTFCNMPTEDTNSMLSSEF